MLYSSDWIGDYADTMGNVIKGDDIGHWRVKVEQTGTYRLTLYRWYPASEIPMAAPIDVEDRPSGGALPVATWLSDEDGTTLSSAYYTKVELIE